MGTYFDINGTAMIYINTNPSIRTAKTKKEADDLSYFGFYQESSDVPALFVGYVVPQGDSECELVEKRIEAPHGVRKIDAVVNFIKSLLN